MLCCPNCFGHSFLNNYIPKISTQKGTCSFCSSPSVPLVDPASLLEYFQSVSSIYIESKQEKAKPLVEWFQSDWNIFSNPDLENAEILLGETLNDKNIIGKRYLPLDNPAPATIDKWAAFREQIMRKNRFLIQHEMDFDRLKALFDTHLETGTFLFDNTLYRARVQIDDSEMTLDKMGKPSAINAKNGRANPIGIPYLYTATTPETAIAETRPHPGDIVFVASFDIVQPLRLLNLQEPRKTVSPFDVAEENLSDLRYNLEFLSHLGSELSKPILPRIADLEYLPTQYLCEFIKNSNYAGVIFMSSLCDGANVVLFDDLGILPRNLSKYIVKSVHYEQDLL